MKKIIYIKKLTNEKYLNLYQVTYNLDGKLYNYNVASRRDLKELESNGIRKTDAVRIIPYLKKDGKIYVALIKEFRYAVNEYVYGVPAGLVDSNESPTASAIRELKEEIGANVKSIKKTQEASYTSAGLTDETIECFEAEVELNSKPSLDAEEDIKMELVPLEKLPQFVSSHKFGLQSALQLKAFYYEKMLGRSLWKK